MSWLLFLIIAAPLSVVSSTPLFVYTLCNDTGGSYSPNTTFQSNLNCLLSDFIESSNSSSSTTDSVGVLYSPDDGNIAHGLYYCRGHVQPADCLSCVQAASARVLQDCPTQKEAVIFYEECTLRYSNRLFPSPQDELPTWISDESPAPAASSTAFNSDPFNGVFERLVGDVGAGVSSPPRFYSGQAGSLGVSVQCSPQIADTDCEACLRASVGVIPSCCGWEREWVMVFRPSCLVEYRFTNSTDYQDYPQDDCDYSDNSDQDKSRRQRQRRQRCERAKWSKILRDFGISVAGVTTSIWSYAAYRKARKHLRSRNHKCHHPASPKTPKPEIKLEIKPERPKNPPSPPCMPPIRCPTYKPLYLDAVILPFDIPDDYQQRLWSANYYRI